MPNSSLFHWRFGEATADFDGDACIVLLGEGLGWSRVDGLASSVPESGSFLSLLRGALVSLGTMTAGQASPPTYLDGATSALTFLRNDGSSSCTLLALFRGLATDEELFSSFALTGDIDARSSCGFGAIAFGADDRALSLFFTDAFSSGRRDPGARGRFGVRSEVKVSISCRGEAKTGVQGWIS